MKPLKKIPKIIFIVLAFTACNDIPDCQLIDEVEYFQVSFFERENTGQPDSVIFESIVVEGFGELLSERDTLHSLLLYVNIADTLTTFYFESDIGTDTLSVSYQTVGYRIESDECGPVQTIEGLDTLHHTFDSLSIENNLLTRDANNIKIFLD